MGAGADRQVWINGTEKWCRHVLQEVRAEDGNKLYGERCTACGAVWALGECAGCLQPHRRLTVASLAGERFCDLDCQREASLRKQKAARAEAKERRQYLKGQGLTAGCAHKRLEDVLNGADEMIGFRCVACHMPVPRSAA